MKHTVKIQACVILATLLAIGGCASNPNHKDAQRVAMRCPAGHTMTCEAKKIGRIFQGSFSTKNDKCACTPDGGRTLDSPRIPTIRQ